MERYYDDPELGRLILKPGKASKGTGFEGVCKRDGKEEYYVKVRLDLNLKKQTTLKSNFATAEDAAIWLAKYLKKNPQVPKVPGKKVSLPHSAHPPNSTQGFSL